MFEKNMKIALLLDFYRDVLDDHTGAILQAYYEDDLSLSEIAEGEGISRQGVRHVIKKGEEQLTLFEERLGLCAHYEELRAAAASLRELREELSATDAVPSARICAVLDEAVNTILNKGV